MYDYCMYSPVRTIRMHVLYNVLVHNMNNMYVTVRQPVIDAFIKVLYLRLNNNADFSNLILFV